MPTASESLRQSYDRDGYLIVDNVLSDTELQALRDRTDAIVERQTDYPVADIELEPGADGVCNVTTVRKLNHCASNDTVYMALARNPKILAIITTLIGEDIKLFDSQGFLKPPGGIEKPYHQDSAYFTIEPMSLITCWTALDDVTIENGCMWAIPGSHQQGLQDHSVRWMIGEREDKRVPDTVINNRPEQAIIISAGSCSFHHSLLLHSSRPNLSPYSRRGLAVHYMSAKSRWTDPQQPIPEYILLQGRDYAGCV